MLRIAVAEDETQCRQVLLDHIRRFARQSGISCPTHIYCRAGELLAHYRGQYDVLLLGIRRGSLDGLDTAAEIRRLDQGVTILFVSDLAQYAIRGYAVRAANFLLKPVDYHTLSEELNRATERVRHNKARYLQIQTEQGLQRLETGAISYIETMGRCVLIHTGGREHRCKETMKELEARLAGRDFFRCHNAYLVNLAYVESVEQTAVTVAGRSLLLSRYKRRPFLDALARYMDGQL